MIYLAFIGIFVLGGMCGLMLMGLFTQRAIDDVREFNDNALDGQELD